MNRIIILCISLLFVTRFSTAQNTTLDSILLNVELEVAEGNNNKALILLNQNFTPNSLKYNLLKGMVYESFGRYDSSSIAYSRAINIDSTYLKAQKGLARTLFAYGSLKLAKLQYEKVLSVDSSCVTSRLQYANLLSKQNNYSGAYRQFIWLTDFDSTNYYYWEQRADCAMQLNNLLDALTSYDNAVNLNRENLDIVVKYMKLLIQLRVPTEEIIAEADSALKIDSLYIPLLKFSGKLYIDMKKYQKSYELFAKAYELGDSSLFTLKYLGISKYNNGLYYQSIPDFERAFKKDSLDSFLNFVYSSALFQIGDRENAIKVIDFTEKTLYPDSSLLAAIYDLKGDLQFANTKYNIALDCYNKANEYSKGKNVEFLFKLGQTNYYIKEYEIAMKYLNDYIIKYNESHKDSDKQGNTWRAKNIIDKIKEENFFKDTL